MLKKNDVERMLSLDSKDSGDTKAFVDANRDQYEVAANTWLLLMEDLSGKYPLVIERYLIEHGLLSSICVALDTANAMIQGDTLPPTPFLSFIHDIRKLGLPDGESSRLVLQGLRYLKRFTVAGSTALRDQSIRTFLATEKRIKAFNRLPEDRFLFPHLRFYLRTLFRNFAKYYAKRKRQSPFLGVPTGVPFEGEKSYQGKVRSILTCDPLYFGQPIAHKTSDRIAPLLCEGQVRRLNRVNAVPKDYKSYRIIAQELAWSQSIAKNIDDAMGDCLLESIPSIGKAASKDGAVWDSELSSWIPNSTSTVFNSQERNRCLAQLGSVCGAISTLDLKSASDSISPVLVRGLLPPDMVTILDSVRADRFIIDGGDGRERLHHIYSTMGSRLTFKLEIAIFWACVRCAYDIAMVPYNDAHVAVYGDDIALDTAVAETAIDVLNYMGFIVNVDKSFMGGPDAASPLGIFRESCGMDYFSGYCVSSYYWPRTAESLNFEHIIALQHRLHQFDHVDEYLCRYILRRWPSTTYSQTGSPYSDLWSDWPTVKMGTAPLKKGSDVNALHVDQSWLLREYHTVVKPVWPSYKYDQMVEEFLYVRFLREGPTYDDPLMELLGCSSPSKREEFLQAEGSKQILERF